jgi:putative aldouronate transport system permease protein
MKKNRVSKSFIYAFFIILSLMFIVPIIVMVSVSISDESYILESGYSIFPQKISFEAYKFVFANPEAIIRSYIVTASSSFLGAFISLLIMMMCAYPLARREFKIKQIVAFYLFFTMIFGGGIVPKYIVVTQILKLKNTYSILVLNVMVNVWFVFILRTFIKNINEAIFESATIDGASQFTVFWKIVMPLSKPAIATFGLFMLLRYWNEWMTALLYIDNSNLYPLQYLLQKILKDLEVVLRNMDKMPAGAKDNYKVPSESVRMAMAVIATRPMLFIMPFFQKYFVRGMQLGSVKG